jgi:hypothetical protein
MLIADNMRNPTGWSRWEFAEDWICVIDEAPVAATSCGPRRTAVGLGSAMYILSHGSGDIGCCAGRRADVAPAGA